MRYIKIENNSPVDYTLEQLFQDNPGAVIYKQTQMPNQSLLATYNVYPLITEPHPQLREDETAEEDVPVFSQGEWHQTWTVRKLTEEEITKIIGSRSFPLSTDSIVDRSFLATAEMQTQRYEICAGCNAFTMLKICSECGCIMPLKIKLANASCPLQNW